MHVCRPQRPKSGIGNLYGVKGQKTKISRPYTLFYLQFKYVYQLTQCSILYFYTNYKL